MPTSATAPRRSPWGLQRRLVTAMTGVMAAILLVVAIVSIISLRTSVTSLVDSQLTGSMASFSHLIDKYLGDPETDSATGAMRGRKPLTDYAGQAPGTVILLMDNGIVADSAVFSDSESAPLNAEAVTQVRNHDWADGERQNITLAGVGELRMESIAHKGNSSLIVGISLEAANDAVVHETLVLSVLALLALATTVISTVLVVRHTLKPLNRVVATAKQVTELPLSVGEVSLHVRVEKSDTDPRTELGKVGEALNHLLHHVDEALSIRIAADKRVKQFVTDASHELRTPLASIQGYAELTRQDSDELPDMTEYSLARIESEAKRMGALVEDLLLLTRLDEGQSLQTSEVDLAELVVNAVNDVRVSAFLHRWVVDVPESAVMVNGDNERLYQLVANLLSNARVHTPADTTVTVALRVQAGNLDERTVELTVTDNGPGIAEDILPRLFERFVRGDKGRSRKTNSTGLGLAIAASIVEAHHGTMTVESQPGRTTFCVRLPHAE
ncbi:MULTISPECIES: ATP-binding protein [unclassified Rhodococcus (in: high G+C Gram-positive bacteria)]|uniref:sensor histidine kinase n=2 Tax=Nocardiaceae TaxID=85025 RepID=UPI0005D349C4|nr:MULTISPECIES: ATP-binding protein [unclassified Rhodococcus (in: high G+C Gram-positive bacteria)]KJF24625.1 putative sensor histidine kinase TcrY [Rhodococcus sp. AD45]